MQGIDKDGRENPLATWALVNAQLANGTRADVVIQGERITTVGSDLADLPSRQEDAAGKLLLPGFIDTHVHLDKVLIRDRLPEHDGTLAGSIQSIQRFKAGYTVEDVRRRAREVIVSSVINGATRFRSHVDVDTIGGMTPLLGVVAAAGDSASFAEVHVIAFPQEGLIRDPGAMELMEGAMREGADVVGGMPHWERSVPDQKQHVRFCFELAERFDAPLDMHVDETDDGSIRTLEMVADEALMRGWHGRVTVGHVCALSAADDEYARRVIDKCARAGMTVVTNAVTNLMIQGRADHGLVRRGLTRVAELREAGVNIAFGQDCVNDGFYPFGRGSMLEVAIISAHAAHLATRAELEFALSAVTDAPALAWGLRQYGITPGSRADFQLFGAERWEEALRLQLPPERVWYRGRLVATTTVTSALAASAGESFNQ